MSIKFYINQKSNDRYVMVSKSSSNSASYQKNKQALNVNGKQVDFMIDRGAHVSILNV